ncbi:PKD domain-containing protein [Candidatus Bipolaricaulota bacterium]|nr:PKD domain-containing protein [Candidatus Bipolaricaulota bacterium]
MKTRQVIIILLFVSLLALSGCAPVDRPQARFTATPSSGLPPLVVEFDAGGSRSPNGRIVSYEWNFGDGTIATGVRVGHTFREIGRHAVTLTVTDETGRTGRITHIIEALNRVPHAHFTVSPRLTVIENEDITFDASASYDEDGMIVEWRWTFGDGATGSGVRVTHAYAQIGTYHVTLIVTDDKGESNSVSMVIRVIGCC